MCHYSSTPLKSRDPFIHLCFEVSASPPLWLSRWFCWLENRVLSEYWGFHLFNSNNQMVSLPQVCLRKHESYRLYFSCDEVTISCRFIWFVWHLIFFMCLLGGELSSKKKRKEKILKVGIRSHQWPSSAKKWAKPGSSKLFLKYYKWFSSHVGWKSC